MSVSYPLALPASPPGLASVEMIAESLAGISASPFTAQQQIQEWPGQFWRAKCALPPMARANAERWLSFLLSLRGITGTFLLGDPLGKTPQSTAGGSPIVNGAGQIGKQLAISGLTGVLKAGDYFHIGSAGENLLLWSQTFANAVWALFNSGASNPTVTDNAIVAPDGTTTAATIAFPSTIGGGVLSQVQQISPGPAAAGGSFTYEIWLKLASGTGTIQMWLVDATGAGAPGSPLTASLTASWQRFNVSGTFPSSAVGFAGVLLRATNQAAITVHAWGAQLERGLVVNNYIPTTSAASGPTRQLLKSLVDAGPGSVTLDLFPRLRTSPLNADPLILTNSVGLFRLASNSTPWSVDKAKFYGIAFEAVEAL